VSRPKFDLGSNHCMMNRRRLISGLFAATAAPALQGQTAALQLPGRMPGVEPRNMVFILSDDHRFDALSSMGHPFVETPHMDRLAREGVNFRNAFVTTSLCSPSRASMLTGLYAHQHKVINNAYPEPEGLIFFPQYLQQAGYRTAFIGKWHMGSRSDHPRPGFHHWVSFRGQGVYEPQPNSVLNVNGRHVPQRGYITDELTGYAVDWLRNRGDQPFFLWLSHKAVHSNFTPAERHKGRYASVKIDPPPTQENTPENFASKPRWVKDQRNSSHGVEFPDQRTAPLEDNYRRYCETLLALDDSVGAVMEELERQGLLDSTLVVYAGDNGFMWGEHGLQDKRAAYEPSIRIPLLARCPGLLPAGADVDGMALNLDIGPTFLAGAGLETPAHMEGRSLLGLANGDAVNWRNEFIYEYHWEHTYPHTPTMHAIRTDRYKYVHLHGVWDTDELYDLREDPLERNNLIASAAHQNIVKDLNARLFDHLERTGGMQIPLFRDASGRHDLRRTDRSGPGDFPPWMMRDVTKQD
jgi:N-acetylglucosamine-6-sulfatase